MKRRRLVKESLLLVRVVVRQRLRNTEIEAEVNYSLCEDWHLA